MLHYDGTPQRAALLSKKYGYYPGDSPHVLDRSAEMKKNQRTVVGASQLREISHSFMGLSLEEKRRIGARQDREERHLRSINMVKNWDNTFAGQRRKKLQARQERFEEEEAERVKQDAEYEEEENERRKAAIERARRLQFFDRDSVKSFHSRVILNQVVRERDMQLELKSSQKSLEKKAEDKFFKEREAETEQAADKERRIAENGKQKRVALAQEQMLQHLARREEEIKELQRKLTDGQIARASDQEYSRKQQDLFEKRKLDKVALQQQLLQMSKQNREEQEAVKRKEEEENTKRSAWIKRKEKQLVNKKLLENKWFSEAQKLSERMGEQQARFTQETHQVEHDATERRQKEAEGQDKLQEKKEAEKKQRQADELKEHYEYARRHAEKVARAEHEEERILGEQYAKEHQDEVRRREDSRLSSLATGKGIQEFLRNQMEINQANRRSERAVRFADDSRAGYKAEDRELEEYARNLLNEPWAQSKTRPLLKCYPPQLQIAVSRPFSGASTSSKSSSTTPQKRQK